MSVLTVQEIRIQKLSEKLCTALGYKVYGMNYFNHTIVLSKNSEPVLIIKYFSDESTYSEIHQKGFIITPNYIKLHDGENYKEFNFKYIKDEFENDKLFALGTVYNTSNLCTLMSNVQIDEVLELMK